MRLLVIPRGPILFESSKYLYDHMDGIYIDGIAKGVDEVTIVGLLLDKEHDPKNSIHSHYNYRFLNSNISIKGIRVPGYLLSTKIAQIWYYFIFPLIIFGLVKNFDCVLTFMPNASSCITTLLAKLFGKKAIVYLGHDWSELPKIKNKIYVYKLLIDYLQIKAIHEADAVLVTGEVLQQKFQEVSKDIYLTRPLISLTQSDAYQRPGNLIHNPLRCICVSILDYRKGIKYLLEAIKLIKAKNMEVHLNIVGSGPLLEELIEYTNQLGISNSVSFLGYINNGPDLWKYYQEADIFILPSLAEGFPRVLYEAMGNCLPIITTNVGGIPKKLTNRENAIVIKPEDPEAIAQGIWEIAHDQELRKKLVECGFKLFMSIDKETPAEQFLYLLNKVCRE